MHNISRTGSSKIDMGIKLKLYFIFYTNCLIFIMTVRVSELVQYQICPRLVYFGARDNERDQGLQQPQARLRSRIEGFILKELAFNLSRIINCESDIAEVMGDILKCVPWIYREEMCQDIDLEPLRADFMRIINERWLKKLRSTRELELELEHGYERERVLYSAKLNLSGSVDKLIIADEEEIPCIIKTGKSPEYGVWRSDRIQLAAYAMLIEDESMRTVRRGLVQYIRDAEFREVQIRRADRAMVLHVLKRVKRVKQGVFPDRSRNAPCENCAYADICNTRKTFLSVLFGQKQK